MNNFDSNHADNPQREDATKIGLAMYRALGLFKHNGGLLTSIRITPNHKNSGDTLVMIKARFDGKSWVSFHSDYDPFVATLGAMNRLAKDKLKWHEDQWEQAKFTVPEDGASD